MSRGDTPKTYQTKARVDALVGRVGTAETTLTTHTSQISTLNSQVSTINGQVDGLTSALVEYLSILQSNLSESWIESMNWEMLSAVGKMGHINQVSGSATLATLITAFNNLLTELQNQNLMDT